MSECEKQHTRVGQLLLELSELSSHAFSQSGNNFHVVVPGDDASTSVRRNKGPIFNRSHQGMAPK